MKYTFERVRYNRNRFPVYWYSHALLGQFSFRLFKYRESLAYFVGSSANSLKAKHLRNFSTHFFSEVRGRLLVLTNIHRRLMSILDHHTRSPKKPLKNSCTVIITIRRCIIPIFFFLITKMLHFLKQHLILDV